MHAKREDWRRRFFFTRPGRPLNLRLQLEELNKKTSVCLPVNPYYITVIQKNNKRDLLFLRRRYKTTLQIALSQSRVTLSLGNIQTRTVF